MGTTGEQKNDNSSTAHNITSLKCFPTHSSLYLMQVKPHCYTIHSETLQLGMLPTANMMALGWLEDWLDETEKVQSPPLLFLAFFQIICSYHLFEALLPGCQYLKTQKTKLWVITYRYIIIYIYVDKHLKGPQNTKDNWWGKTVGNFSFFFFNCYICEINWKGGKILSEQ